MERNTHAIEACFARYKQFAFVVFNTFLLIFFFWAVLNGALWAAFKLWDAHLKMNNPIVKKYGGAVQNAYPGWAPKDLDLLLKENWNRPLESDFFLMLKESAFRGTYVNVDPAGFRWSADQGPWPPDPQNFNVFFFGGSTGFGYGVRDNETVASQLAQGLQRRGIADHRTVKIYNFGRAGYYSTPERMLFERLVLEGHLPQLAVFMDGLNEFEHASDNTADFNRMIDRWVFHPTAALGRDLTRVVFSPPLQRLAQTFSTGVVGWILRGKKPAPPVSPINEEQATRIIERYRGNQRIIQAVGDAYHVPCFFAWQPIPYYEFDLSQHVMGQLNPGRQSAVGYAVAARTLNPHPPPHFFWMAEMQKGLGGILYVDSVHYSARMSQKIADSLSDALLAFFVHN